MKYDLIVKNGHVVDPAAGWDLTGSIGFKNGLSEGLVPADAEASEVVDAEGYYVFPGFIDYHAHLSYGGSAFGVCPDLLIPQGVTTAADAGTPGCANFEGYYRDVVCRSLLRVKTFISICPIGQPGDGVTDMYDPALFHEEKLTRLFRDYPDQLVGIKLRIGAEVLEGRGLEPLKRAQEIAKHIGVPIVVHTSNPPEPMAKCLEIFEKGDVCCHVYHGKGENIAIDGNGHVHEGLWKARERGVLFDVANGKTNYNHEVAEACIREGFLPDIISSDNCRGMVFNYGGYCPSLPYAISKFLWLGMSMTEVIRCVTEVPARELKLPKAGTLKKGSYGDLAMCRIVSAKPVYLDNFGHERIGDRLLVPMMTVKDGEILYRNIEV